MTALPDLDTLFENFYVDSTSPTGLRWAKATYHNIKKPGDVAGSRCGKYWRVCLDGVEHYVHRIVLAMRTGENCVDLQVDHIDQDSTNNHPFNLRWLSSRLQHQNTSRVSASGHKGVYFQDDKPRSRPWRATIWIDGKHKTLGFFATAEEASVAYQNALEELS